MTPDEARQTLREQGFVEIEIDGEGPVAEQRARARISRWARAGGMIVATSKLNGYVRAVVTREFTR